MNKTIKTRFHLVLCTVLTLLTINFTAFTSNEPTVEEIPFIIYLKEIEDQSYTAHLADAHTSTDTTISALTDTIEENAHMGHSPAIAHIINEHIIECIQLIQNISNDEDLDNARNHMREALKWYYRLITRMQQDISCLDKTHTGFEATIGLVNYLMKASIGQLITLLLPEFSTECQNVMKDAFFWTKILTQNNKLPVPTTYDFEAALIGMYGREKPPYFPQDQWKEKRLAALEELEETVNNNFICSSNL